MSHLFINDLIRDIALVPVFLRRGKTIFNTLPSLQVIKPESGVRISRAVFIDLAVACGVHPLNIFEPRAELASLVQACEQALLSQVFENDLAARHDWIIINRAVLTTSETLFRHIFLVTVITSPKDKAGIDAHLILKLRVLKQAEVEILPIFNKVKCSTRR